ncbi:hypothetical protein FEM48_ZijujUnG0035300 [Ziziphus jujuba var. spinosa]|uniref:B-like cyclin n=1 Tax=Ziziphus jujuba var. spinosa TaxID=714518 RepID=A0A978U9G8_ZIZJJ|nr:hypothetical protein FEM48_ZijujUnG0035300 [Ziziphus jujuba var. spinosa]
MGDSDSWFCISSLLCQEDEACFNKEEDGYDDDDEENMYIGSSKPCFVFEDEDEYVEDLLKREVCFGYKGFSSSDDCSSVSHTRLKSARLDAIDWIFNTREVFGFQIRTAYLSVTYFDRFLSKRHIDDGKLWAFRLLSVACLSLAAKMEECRVPTLSEFLVQDYDFESKVIQKMELLVLNTLEWKMGSITPFAYLHYFINKFCGESRPKGLVSSAVQLIVTIAKGINLMDIRPSIIAAAAVLAASDGQLTRKTMELKMSLMSTWHSKDNDIEKIKVKTPKSSISPNVLSIHSGSQDVLENAPFNSASGTKRRLSFSHSDHTSSVNKIYRT